MVMRLDQVVVGAGIEPGDALLDAVARREDQERQLEAALAPAAQPHHAVATRQAEVQHDRIERLRRRAPRRPGAVAEPVDGVAELTQAGGQRVTEQDIVLDDQQTHDIPAPVRRKMRTDPPIMRSISATSCKSDAAREPAPSPWTEYCHREPGRSSSQRPLEGAPRRRLRRRHRRQPPCVGQARQWWVGRKYEWHPCTIFSG